MKGRENGEGGELFEGGDYFKDFRQRGAVIRGTAIIRGNTVFTLILVFRQSFENSSITIF